MKTVVQAPLPPPRRAALTHSGLAAAICRHRRRTWRGDGGNGGGSHKEGHYVPQLSSIYIIVARRDAIRLKSVKSM